MPRKKKGPTRGKRVEPKKQPRKNKPNTKSPERKPAKRAAPKSKPKKPFDLAALRKGYDRAGIEYQLIGPRKQRKPSKKDESGKRSLAAKKGWETRRKRLRQLSTERSSYHWQRWVYGWKIQMSATLLYNHPIEGKIGEKFLREDTRKLMERVRTRMPRAKLFGGCILYKRSSDGKKWDDGIVPKYLDWRTSWEDALALFTAMSLGFYNDLTRPDRMEHAYKVKIVGLAARACGRRKQEMKEDYGEQSTLPGIVSESRIQRNKRRLGES